jgi:hypothetical protein
MERLTEQFNNHIVARRTTKEKRYMTRTLLVIAVCCAIVQPLEAETVSNYSDCKTCWGSIHYDPGETLQILGQKTFDLAARLSDMDEGIIKRKIDLEGVKTPGSAKDPDDGYEIKIAASRQTIYIRDLKDKSYIHLVPDFDGLAAGRQLKQWRPEIFLQAGVGQKIELKDPLTLAWKKMKTSSIYQWVESTDPTKQWTENLKDSICWVFELLLTDRH